MGWFLVYHRHNRFRRLLTLYRNTFLCVFVVGIVLFVNTTFLKNNTLKICYDVAGFVSEIVTKPYYSVLYGLSWSKNFFVRQETVTQLYNKTEKLKSLENAYIILEKKHRVLKKSMKYIAQNDKTQITTHIFMANSFGGTKIFWINVGQNDGLQRYQTVVCHNVLIGRLIDVGCQYSKILPVDHPLSKTPVFVGKNEYRAVAKGIGEGLMSLEHLNNTSFLSEGDSVVTSGDGGVFPKGILLGSVFFGEDGRPYVRWKIDLWASRCVAILKHQPALIHE